VIGYFGVSIESTPFCWNGGIFDVDIIVYVEDSVGSVENMSWASFII